MQAGLQDSVLIRDYNQPHDMLIPSDTEVDLADGNVFRAGSACDATAVVLPPHESPKLAFIVDDAWEITVQSTQTLESLCGLFDLPEDAEVFRDFESPNDEMIHPGMPVQFSDGPVFHARIKSITIKVNNQPVHLSQRRVTGIEIKQAAIAQGVSIDLGFVLYRVKPGGGLGPAIRDDEHLTLRKCDEFRCVAPDDNS